MLFLQDKIQAMKLVSYLEEGEERLGIFRDGKIYNLSENAHLSGEGILPDKMGVFLEMGENAMRIAHAVDKKIRDKKISRIESKARELNIIAPVPHPTSCRDGYAFRQHVEAARRNRKVPMIPEFDQYP